MRQVKASSKRLPLKKLSSIRLAIYQIKGKNGKEENGAVQLYFYKRVYLYKIGNKECPTVDKALRRY